MDCALIGSAIGAQLKGDLLAIAIMRIFVVLKSRIFRMDISQMAKSAGATWVNRIGRRLKLRDLHVFLAVAEWQNMGKAAQHLAISRPVVSKTISDLEHALGVDLVERNPEGIELTMYGRVLFKWGMAIFDDLRQSVQEIESLSDPSLGEIRISCPETIAAGIMPVIIERISRKHPRAVVQVFHTSQSIATPLLFRELRERSIDIFFGRILSHFDEDDLVADIIFDDRMFVVAGMQSPWARKRKIDLADLVDEPWILPPEGHVIGTYFANAFQAKKLKPPRARVMTYSTPLISTLLRNGRYLTMRPDIVLHFEAKRLGLTKLPIELPSPPGPFAIVRLKKRVHPPLVPVFIECAKEVVKMNFLRPKSRKS